MRINNSDDSMYNNKIRWHNSNYDFATCNVISKSYCAIEYKVYGG